MKIRSLFIVAVLFALSPHWGYSDDKSDLLVREVQALVKDLDNDHFDVRHKATDKLIEMGKDTGEPLRQELLKATDPEVRYRINLVLKKLKIDNTAQSIWELELGPAGKQLGSIVPGKRKFTFELGGTNMNSMIGYESENKDAPLKGIFSLGKLEEGVKMYLQTENASQSYTFDVLRIDPEKRSFTVGYLSGELFTLKLVEPSKYNESYEIFSKEIVDHVKKQKK